MAFFGSCCRRESAVDLSVDVPREALLISSGLERLDLLDCHHPSHDVQCPKAEPGDNEGNTRHLPIQQQGGDDASVKVVHRCEEGREKEAQQQSPEEDLVHDAVALLLHLAAATAPKRNRGPPIAAFQRVIQGSSVVILHLGTKIVDVQQKQSAAKKNGRNDMRPTSSGSFKLFIIASICRSAQSSQFVAALC